MTTNVCKATSKSRILIVDDHPVVRWGMSQLVNQETDLVICCEAGNGKEALNAMRNCRHDLAIVDISLKDASGLSLIKSIQALDEHIHILVMSMHDESIYAERAMRAGASGYIMKQEAPDNVLKAIRYTLAGEIYLSSKINSRLLKQLFEKKPGLIDSPVSALSDAELEVLRLIGNGLSTREIAEFLNRSIKTIETHRGHIKDKLQLNASLELVRFSAQWLEHSI